MTDEEIIDQIRSEHPEISEVEIAERLKKEKRRTGGFISEATLLRMIAAQMGMETQSSDLVTPTLSVLDLIPGLGDVTVVGRVIAVFPPKTFNGDRKGKIASLLIADELDIVRVVMWNDRTELVEPGKVKVGQILRVSHAYAKEGRGGKVELHVGERCKVEVDPPGVEANKYPTIGRFTTRINQITLDQKSKKVNVIGKVKKLFSASTFEREDSSSGKVMRFILFDETGEISVVAWNEKVDEIQSMLKEDAGLQIVNAKVRKAMEQKAEIHIDSETYVATFVPEEEPLRIADLKGGLTHVNIEGEVATKPVLRDVKTFKKEIVGLATFELKDDTGRIWVSAWREHSSIASKLKMGDRVMLKNAQVKNGFGDQLEISTKDKTNIIVVT
jgi:ssDNA-binding replication factor A large subunit